MKPLLILAILCVPMPDLHAQAPCATCDGTGVMPCRVCADVEVGTLACTVSAACRTCRGALATDCGDCVTAAGSALRRQTELAQEFATAHRALLDEHDVGTRGVLRCRTEHFDLLLALGRVQGSPEPDPHRALHLYAARLETLRQQVEDRLGTMAPARTRLALVRDAGDHRRLARGWTGLEVQGLGRLRGGIPPTAVLRAAPKADDRALHGLLAHSATHLLLELPDTGYGWLDSGLAHWFEAAQVGRCRYFCIQATPQAPQTFWDGDWQVGARELLESGALPALPDVLSADTSDLDFAGHALAYALVDFLLVQLPPPVTHESGPQPPPPVVELLARVRAGTSETPLSDVLGRDLPAIEAAFVQFVRERYPRR